MSSNFAVGHGHAERLLAIVPERPAVGPARATVLVIDSDREVADLLATHLPAMDSRVIFAATPEEARERLAEDAPALIACNPELAGRAAWRFLQLLTEHAARLGATVLVLKRDEQVLSDVEMYLLGVDVVLGPPVQGNEVIALVRGQLRKLSRQRRTSLQDPVTGHASVEVFRDAYTRAASLAAREREPLSLVILQLGAAAAIRRENGNEAADAAMRKVADSVAATLRNSDLLARGDGDSLLLLLPNTDVDGAGIVVEKVVDRLERSPRAVEQESGDLLLLCGIVEATRALGFDHAAQIAHSRLQRVRSPEERALDERGPIDKPGQHHVLVAEDDALTASIIRHRLERLGYRVTHVADGAALLRTCPEEDFSLLVLDVKMPYVDGFEALRRLRSIRALREIPVVMVTSLGDEEDIARGFELGADDYVVKPFSPLELQARVQRLLR